MDAQTRLYAVWGHPVAHSFSPYLHSAAFAAHRINAAYVACDVHPQELGEAVVGARALKLAGFNLTIPHKERILPFLDLVDPLASRIGAVNTVRLRENRLEGFNTDGAGFLAPLKAQHGFDAEDATAVLLGAGGAARAVAFALADVGASRIVILNRTRSRADALADDLRGAFGMLDVTTAELQEPVDHPTLATADLVVQCTSRGLGRVEPLAVDWSRVKGSAIVADLVYGRGDGPFLAAAAAAGFATHSGVWMLIGQAALAFELWTGIRFDLEAGRRWLADALDAGDQRP